MATADQRYAEKVAARASGRAPAFQQQPAPISETSSVHDRYLAKLAARRAPAGAQAAPTVKPEPKAEKPQVKAKTELDDGKAPESKPEPKDAPKK